MSLSNKDRVLETSPTAGLGAYALAGAVTGYQSFAAVGDANTCHYAAWAVDPAFGMPTGDWETGVGTYDAAGTTLARTAVVASSNGGAAVSWAAGTKRIACCPLATKFDGKADLAGPAFTGTPTAPTATGGTNTTQIATTQFVTAAVGAVGGLAVGGTVTGGTAGRVLFEGAGPVLADDANLTYDAATGAVSATRYYAAPGLPGFPGYGFTGTPFTGMYSPGSNFIAFSSGGDPRMAIDSTHLLMAPNTEIAWGPTFGTIDVGFVRAAAGVLKVTDGASGLGSLTAAQLNNPTDGGVLIPTSGLWSIRNGANPQTFRVYTTYVDANNGAWIDLAGTGTNSLPGISSGGNGTGVAGSAIEISSGVGAGIYFSFSHVLKWSFVGTTGSLVPSNDNAVDVGSASVRVRAIYAGSGTFDGPVTVGPYTFATVPSAASVPGAMIRITDRSGRHAYSDGTNWRFFADDVIIS